MQGAQAEAAADGSEAREPAEDDRAAADPGDNGSKNRF